MKFGLKNNIDKKYFFLFVTYKLKFDCVLLCREGKRFLKTLFYIPFRSYTYFEFFLLAVPKIFKTSWHKINNVPVTVFIKNVHKYFLRKLVVIHANGWLFWALMTICTNLGHSVALYATVRRGEKQYATEHVIFMSDLTIKADKISGIRDFPWLQSLKFILLT